MRSRPHARRKLTRQCGCHRPVLKGASGAHSIERERARLARSATLTPVEPGSPATFPQGLAFHHLPSVCSLPAQLLSGTDETLQASTPAGLWLIAPLSSPHFKEAASQGKQILLLLP